jgi:hypothetical protein
LEMGSPELFAQTGFKLWSSRSQPPKKLGLQAWATGTLLCFLFLSYVFIFYFYFFCFIIHMCIQGLGHFSPLPPPPLCFLLNGIFYLP